LGSPLSFKSDKHVLYVIQDKQMISLKADILEKSTSRENMLNTNL